MELSLKYAAWMLNVSVKKMNSWVNENNIPYITIKEQYLFNKVELLEWAIVNEIPISTEAFIQNKEDDTTNFLEALKLGGVHYCAPEPQLDKLTKIIIENLYLPNNTDTDFLADIFMASESLGYNVIGNGIALQKVRNPLIQHVKHSFVSLCYMEEPIKLNETNALAIHAIFTIVSTTTHEHLYLLAQLNRLLNRQEIKEALFQKVPEQELLKLMAQVENKLK